MTNDKGAGERPYTVGISGNVNIINKKSGCAYMGLEMRSVNVVCSWMNEAYAEGRKSMEKELEELYKIASELCIERNNLYGFETDGILDFAAYKKLRGIE